MAATVSRAVHEAELARRDARIDRLEGQPFELRRLLQGFKSERSATFIPADQLALFGGESTVTTTDDDPPGTDDGASKETPPPPRPRRSQKPHPGRGRLPDDLPVEEIVLEPAEDTRGLVQIGEEVSESLDYRPGHLVLIRRRRRPKYARLEVDGSTSVLIAELPSRPIAKGVAEPGLLAELCVAKYVDHLPFYRQIKRFERDHGWVVHKSTINDWFAATCCLLEPLYQKLLATVVGTDYLQVDESTIKVQDSAKRGSTHLGYQWVYRDPATGLILFDYRKGRGAHGVLERLAEFTGYLQTDGYRAYQTYLARHPTVTGVSCLAHIRRKFFDARANHPRLAEMVLATIAWLYHVDAHCRRRGRSPTERLALRRRLSLPVYTGLVDYVTYAQANNLSKGDIGKALYYAKNELPKLAACFQDGRIELDNNLIENSIRPLALGRKNYLFAGSHQGAQRAAMLYSFFASCQKLGVNPREWLADVLARLPDHAVNRLDELLPHRWTKPSD